MSKPDPKFAERIVEKAAAGWWVDTAYSLLLQYDSELEAKQATEQNEMRKSVYSARRAMVAELVSRKPKIR